MYFDCHWYHVWTDGLELQICSRFGRAVRQIYNQLLCILQTLEFRHWDTIPPCLNNAPGHIHDCHAGLWHRVLDFPRNGFFCSKKKVKPKKMRYDFGSNFIMSFLWTICRSINIEWREKWYSINTSDRVASLKTRIYKHRFHLWFSY